MLKSYLASLEGEERKKALRAYQRIAPRTGDWLWDYLDIYLGVRIPRVQVCPNHVAPFTAFANAFFVHDPIAVWKASRGFGGKTMLLSLLGVTELILLGANIRLLGGSGDQSQNINDYMRGVNPRTRGTFWDAPLAPRHLLQSSTRTEIRTKNGGYVKALMASQASVRGAHPSRLRLDEIDVMPLDIFDAAMGQTMSDRNVKAQTVASSTHQNPDGTMTEAIRRARENGWGYYEWCFAENLKPHGWLSQEMVDQKKREVPESMWLAEFVGQEPNPEGRVFSEDTLRGLFRPELGVFGGAPGEAVVVSEPSERRHYLGADWGRKKDYTVLHVMEEVPRGPDTLAAWVRVTGGDWQPKIEQYNRWLSEYGGRGMHDETGIGDVIRESLMGDTRGFIFSKVKERDAMLSDYVLACESGEIAYPLIQPLYDAHRYLTHEELYGHKHLPDELAAAALAWKAKKSRKRGGLLVARA